MTGFDSKRQAAQAKLDDDGDAQVDTAMLTIVYQRGFSDGKKAAQRKPLTDEEIDVLANNNGTVDLHTWWREFARAIEAAHGIKEKT